MSKTVTPLRSGGNPLEAASYGISLDHVHAVRRAIAREDRARSHSRSVQAFDRSFDRRDRLAAVRDAAFDALTGSNFNPDCHDITLEHARAVAEVMAEEADLIRSGLRRGRIRPMETFELLFEVHELVCSMIENTLESCL